MAAFFFFFFDELWHISEIQQAFENICLNKMLSDGYFDMSAYIYGRLKREELYAQLVSNNSKYAPLYRGRFPRKEDAYSVWHKRIGEKDHDSNNGNHRLSDLEAKAIVNWVYRILKKTEEKVSFTKQILEQSKRLRGIEADIKIENGVVYNDKKVEIHFFSSISSVSDYVSSLQKKHTLFFRGHADPNYILQPSIMRSKQLLENESKLYQDLIINCPDDFEKCYSHLEKLVKMQHYGLPTRLLDITRNLLVALHFACESKTENFGELILISPEAHEVKYPHSDVVSILASLPLFSYETQQTFAKLASDTQVPESDFNKKVVQLIQEVRLEKPAFQSEIKKVDLINNFIVLALKNNNRIIKQDGAFIICGLSNHEKTLEEFRYKENGKSIIILIDKKKRIREQLETFSINHATLFPEIECVAEYLKRKYSI